MTTDMAKLITDELNNRGWSQSELARRAKLSQGNLSNILAGERQAGPKVCTAIANALGLPKELLFRAAGLLPPIPSKESPYYAGIMDVVKQMSLAEQQETYEYALWRLQRKKKDQDE